MAVLMKREREMTLFWWDLYFFTHSARAKSQVELKGEEIQCENVCQKAEQREQKAQNSLSFSITQVPNSQNLVLV